MEAIKLIKLKKHFGRIKAVDGISFNINKGEIFGFLGPNGAGKTTAIRCMMNFLYPTSGNIKVLGMDSVKDTIEIRKRVGYLASGPRLYENLTGKEHIEFIEKIKGKSNKKEQLISDFGADINQKVKTLSTGNKQKISLILTLMHNPEIVILDEPTSGLDPILQNKIYEILNEMKQEGKTIFMSSHNLSEVEKICQRVAIIRKGKLVAIEDIKKLNKKRLYRVWIAFEKSNDSDIFLKFPKVNLVSHTGSELFFTYQGDIQELIKLSSKINLKDIKIEHAGLEETFLNFYKE